MGRQCASRVTAFHKLHHYRYHMAQSVRALLRERLPDRLAAVGARDLETLVSKAVEVVVADRPWADRSWLQFRQLIEAGSRVWAPGRIATLILITPLPWIPHRVPRRLSRTIIALITSGGQRRSRCGSGASPTRCR